MEGKYFYSLHFTKNFRIEEAGQNMMSIEEITVATLSSQEKLSINQDRYYTSRVFRFTGRTRKLYRVLSPNCTLWLMQSQIEDKHG